MKYMLFTGLILCSFVWIYASFSQTLDNDYEKREKSVDPFEDEDCLDCHPPSITEKINRIKWGDRIILRLAVFDTFEVVMEEAKKRAKKGGVSLCTFLGPKSIYTFIEGLDNQDPKVRLRCIGYLGKWVDKVGKDTKLIEEEIDRRLNAQGGGFYLLKR